MGNVVFPTLFKLALRFTHLPIQWVLSSISSGVKRWGRETDHLLPASAEIKKMWIYTSTPPYAFMMYRDKFFLKTYKHVSGIKEMTNAYAILI
jgi:hypothetical protein